MFISNEERKDLRDRVRELEWNASHVTYALEAIREIKERLSLLEQTLNVKYVAQTTHPARYESIATGKK